MKMLGNLIKFLDNNWAKMFSCIFTGQNGCQTSLEWALKSFCVENTPRDEMNFENYSRYWNFVFRKKKKRKFFGSFDNALEKNLSHKIHVLRSIFKISEF